VLAHLLANEEVYDILGVPFPEEMERCLQFVSLFEGTERILRGNRESGDDFPVVTYGIIGFTSNDGSPQWFLWEANNELAGALARTIGQKLGDTQESQFQKLISIGIHGPYLPQHEAAASNAAFVAWALDDGRAKKPWVAAFSSFDSVPGYTAVHRKLCIKKCMGA
jgi:hypothetical protein